MGLHSFRLPDIGEGVVEGEVVEWFVAVGDAIVEDQPLLSVMTDKATVEIPSPVTGTVAHLSGDVGDILPVGEICAQFEVEGDGDGSAAAPAEAPAEAAPAPAPEPEPSPPRPLLPKRPVLGPPQRPPRAPTTRKRSSNGPNPSLPSTSARAQSARMRSSMRPWRRPVKPASTWAT